MIDPAEDQRGPTLLGSISAVALITADALPAIISNLQGRGFQLVTISKLLQ
jgi:peptidoglycan/xylan/chitin deacetylase (PgdA/CDA1 family)